MPKQNRCKRGHFVRFTFCRVCSADDWQNYFVALRKLKG